MGRLVSDGYTHDTRVTYVTCVICVTCVTRAARVMARSGAFGRARRQLSSEGSSRLLFTRVSSCVESLECIKIIKFSIFVGNICLNLYNEIITLKCFAPKTST